MIVGKTENFIDYKAKTKTKLASQVNIGDWKDYKWQFYNSIKTIAAFEKFTGISFSKSEKMELEETISKFPLCITPYYASLVEKKNYRDDPIFKQAFPNPAELIISECDYERPAS